MEKGGVRENSCYTLRITAFLGHMLFAKTKFGNLYIHGAYWHNKFGKPASHGCVNISYNDIENLYNWTDEGVRVLIE